ncbi:hypothetical protein [Desulfatitalea alkaliphila]|uniref:Uncharacterized protein n=1 Tax=Desulfatitalea alkaliphila TaxID=2929485 RepID=A0AA41UIH5_9BACT|nr:hypothetical protein [Desulfatitalea alkaliphila]MCJ8500099.1 hypothetical protein [Desulfatitalea alkaliphila]
MALKDYHIDRVKQHISVLDKYEHGGSVFVDRRRSRPRWFDGRFLKAADLNRESSYFLTRQADLAVATGTGVVEGLMVRETGPTRIAISHGHGMTFDGERVFLPEDVDIRLHNIALSEELNVKMGLSRKPAPPDRSRSGIYIIALRPLEFTANPTAAYPVDVDGRRQLQDGSVVEATAITLIPFSYPAGAARSIDARRARLAHQLFTETNAYRMPSTTLPLAMIELRRGQLLWLDNYMVRREMGAVHSDVLGFGFTPRPLRRSHFKQYDEMIADIVDRRLRSNAGLRFAATEYFESLPAAGRLPTACVDLDNFTQHFFPDAMDVEISIVPEDEMGLLLEESMLLPPVPLNDENAIATTAVMIFLPVPRHTFHSETKVLKRLPTPIQFPIKTVRSRFTPKDYLNLFQAKLPDFKTPAPGNTQALQEVAWKRLLSGQTFVWYVRRRNLNYKDEISGSVVHVMTNEHQDETDMRRYQRSLNLYDDFTYLKVRGSAAADLEMVRLLTIPKFTKSEVLMRSALKEFGNADKLDERHAASVSVRFAGSQVGKGLERIEERLFAGTDAEKIDQKIKLADALCTPELDDLARVLTAEEAAALADEVHTRLHGPDTPEAVAEFIRSQKKELER